VFFGNNLPLKDYYDISGMPEYMSSARGPLQGLRRTLLSLVFERDEEIDPVFYRT